MNLLTASKLKIYILASENEKWIKISAYPCDVGVKFEQVVIIIIIIIIITLFKCQCVF